MQKFEKIFGVDTNIIVDNHSHIFNLSEKGKNLIVIPKTVLQELDNLKTKGNDFIRYEIRRFQEIINKNMEVVKIFSIGTLIKVNSKYNTYILLYNNPNSKIYSKNFNNNDEKIIEEFKELKEFLIRGKSGKHKIEMLQGNILKEDFSYEKDYEIISNDLLFRTIGVSEGLTVKPLLSTMYDTNISLETEVEIEEVLGNKEWFESSFIKNLVRNTLEKTNDKEKQRKLEEILQNFDKYTFIKLIDGQGHPWHLQRYNYESFKVFNEETYKNIMGITPRNFEQKKALEILLNPNNDIVVLEGIAGTAKTLTALLAAIKLKEIDNSFKNIYYIRKTLISGNKLDELGFLPGSLEEKLMGYLYPLKDNIELLIRTKNKKKKNYTKEELEKAIEEFESKHNIQYLYQGHLRGGNLKGIVILDEAQNFSIQDIRLILSRMQENTKVIIIGSIGQIDNPYLTKENNALTYMLNNCGILKCNKRKHKEEDRSENCNNIQIQGLRLKKVERGPIADWIEHQFD